MSKIFAFALGAAAGSLVTWKLVEEKYKKIADEEIESVIEQFRNRAEVDGDGLTIFGDNVVVGKVSAEPVQCADVEIEEVTPWNSKEEKEEYEEQVEAYSVQTKPAKEHIAPYVISPDEFGEFGNEIVSLIYYADGVLADDENVVVSDSENIVGDALSHFGDFEEDAVHVRNENLEWDIEILKSEKTFDEVYKEEN